MTAGRFPQVWDLASLLPHPSSPEFRTCLNEYKAELLGLVTASRSLPAVTPAAADQWAGFLEAYGRLDAVSGDLRAFLECHCAAEAENPIFLQLDAEVAALSPQREEVTTNLEFALKEASSEQLDALLKADPRLEQIAYFVRTRQKNAALRLPREQELLAADLAVDGLHAWGRLYDRLCGSLRVTVTEKGQPVTKSVGQVHFDSAERSVRENNFFAADAAWSSITLPCTEAINHIAGTRLTTYRRAGIQDYLEVPLRLNRMTRETLTTMWQVITERKGVLKDYLERKAQLLGLKQLAWYDLSAPLPQLPGAVGADKIPYDQAGDWIIESFTRFSPDFGEFARMALEKGWIEAENRAGKRQGGFCTGFPKSKQTRIFMTYTDSADAMSTLAHELGHAYHSWVLRDEPILLQDYPMNLAETASTFAEAVLGARRLEQSTSTSERLNMLEGMLGDAVGFLMNIHARFLFENEFHRERAAGEVNSERLNLLMQQAQQEAYLGALADGGWNPRFWVSKLHFYITGWPFYNFPYTFGYLLSMGVFAVGQETGPGFAEDYRKLLLATGCMDAEEAVQSTLGFDLRKPDFWHKSLDIVEARVKQFCQLADEVVGKCQKM